MSQTAYGLQYKQEKTAKTEGYFFSFFINFV